MKFSLIISTYDFKRMNDLDECARSLLRQNFRDFEIIIVVDHNPELFKVLGDKYAQEPLVKVVLNSSVKGLAECMNCGVIQSDGDLIGFVDDDAMVDNDYLLELSKVFKNDNVYGVGGRVMPIWLCKEPQFLPKKFQWLIGSTDSLYPHRKARVRNVWSSNASFRREIFEKVGSFRTSLGRHGDELLQGEDMEFGLRCSKALNGSLIYHPKAIVYHKIYPERVRLKSLLARAYKQGYSKACVFELHRNSDALSLEKIYLREILTQEMGPLIAQCFLGPNKAKALKCTSFMLVASFMVLAGFIAGLIAGKK